MKRGGRTLNLSTYMIRLERFGKDNYADLISWVGNAEELMQFAGPAFIFPLNTEQLDISLSDTNRIAFRLVSNETDRSIGHSEIYLSENSAKIGRILIGNKDFRGKGLCRQIMNLLLDQAFNKFKKEIVELNVFDWNIGAIKCYEKAGFKINPDKRLERKVNDKTWIALNMTIDRLRYEQNKVSI
jgi:RimJ/RimL family protein N-acetyltransferase